MAKITGMTVPEIEAEIVRVKERREKLFARQKPIVDRLVSTGRRLRRLDDLRDRALLKDKGDDWEFLLEETGGSSRSRALAAEHALRKLDLRSSGFYSGINQRAVEIALNKKDSQLTARVLTGLREVLPFIKEIPDYGGKRITIFEHTLSRGAVYSLVVTSDGKALIYANSYARGKFKDLESALAFIQENHWYTGGDSEDEEDDNY